MLTVVALPGLHGTPGLFERFEAARPDGVGLLCLGYSADECRSYAELADSVVARLPSSGSFGLVAESFSGPVALRVAARTSPRFVALCASFASSPVPAAARGLPWRTLFSLRVPDALVAWLLTGGDRTLSRAVAAEIERVRPEVLAHRVSSVLEVDDVELLDHIRAPLLYLRATLDRLVPASAAQRLRARREDLSVVDVTAPHLVLQTSAREAWQALLPYLARAD